MQFIINIQGYFDEKFPEILLSLQDKKNATLSIKCNFNWIRKNILE